MNNALLHNNFNFNFSNQHSNPPAWKCGPFPKDSSNFLDFLVFSVFFFWPQFCPKLALWRVLELCWVRGETSRPWPQPPGPPRPPLQPPQGLQVATRPFCFIFGAFLPAWWIFFIFKKSACSICAAGLWNGHPALSAHRNTKVTKASSEVAQAGPSSLQHKAKQGGHNKSQTVSWTSMTSSHFNHSVTGHTNLLNLFN